MANSPAVPLGDRSLVSQGWHRLERNLLLSALGPGWTLEAGRGDSRQGSPLQVSSRRASAASPSYWGQQGCWLCYPTGGKLTLEHRGSPLQPSKGLLTLLQIPQQSGRRGKL